MFVVLLGAGIVAGLVASYSRNLPDINRMADYQPSRSTRVIARDGSLLANLYTENRIWVPIAQIPVPVRNAFIATEDQHFYQHHGVDFAAGCAIDLAKAAALDGRKNVALEQDAFGPSRRQHGGIVLGQAHDGLTPLPQTAGCLRSIDRDRSARGR